MRLVYFSPVPWASFSQRAHKFVEWLHTKRDGEVLWIDPYPTRLPMLEDFQRLKPKGINNTRLTTNGNKPAWLTVLRPRALPIEPLFGVGMLNRLLWNEVLQTIDAFLEEGECLLSIGKPSELAELVLSQHPTIPSHYDAMDDFPAFYRGMSRTAMKKRECEIASRVSLILASSTALADRFAKYSSNVVLVFNACAVENLPPINNLFVKESGTPILGYVGTIGHWFDWPLVFELAESNPSMCIRLIGPIYAMPPAPLPRNIELLPPIDHATAIRAMQEFSVGLIPFKRTELTASVDPIKYYEYRAMGLPVISSRFGEMARREGQTGVFLVDADSNLSILVRTAMSCETDIIEIQEFRTANSWETRFGTAGILP